MQKEVKAEIAKNIAETLSESVTPLNGSIIFREGQALPLHEPEKVTLLGTIDAPARWIEKRADTVNQKECYVEVNREKMIISLRTDESNYYGTTVYGKLELSPEYNKFGINGGDYITNFEMAEMFKMNRAYFENRSVAMKLVTDLQNFKAKVDKEIENSDNKRGDRRILINQAVQSNLPEAFNLVIPVFKGCEKQTVQVEVYVNPNDFTCTLVSAQSNELIIETRDTIIDEVLERIRLTCPDIVIIEQ